MGRNDGATKPSLDVASVVAGMKDKKSVGVSQIKADFQATIEKLLSGKEIIKVAHRDPRLDKPNSNQFVDFKLQQLLNNHQIGNGEAPGWLVKVYENLELQEDHPKVQSSCLLQHLTHDLITYEEKRNVQPPPLYQNNDINDSKGGKISANEVLQLIDDSLNLKKFNFDFKLLRPLKIQILQEKLDETLVKLKSLLTERPKGWGEMYAMHASTVKTIIKKLEEFLKEIESAVLKEPVQDLKKKTVDKFALEAKKNLQNFKQSFKRWDHLGKIILEIDKPFLKNDDIILVKERKEDSTFETSKNNDEL